MSTWDAFCFIVWIISAVPAWIPYTVAGICLYIAGLWTWVHISRVRERRQALAEQLAAETAKYGEGWSADATDGTWWPVDLEAIAEHHTGPYYGDTFTPERGSDPWLHELYPDAPTWPREEDHR